MPRHLHIKPYHKSPYLEPITYRISVGMNTETALNAFKEGNAAIKPIYCKSTSHEAAIYRVSTRHVREHMRLWLRSWHGMYALRHVGVEGGNPDLFNTIPIYTLIFRAG
jgi:hypothetical protein